MTDAFIFEVHADQDVFEVNGRKVVRAKYVFDSTSMAFSPNTDESLTRGFCGRLKDGRVFAGLVTLTKDQFHRAAIPAECYVEKSC